MAMDGSSAKLAKIVWNEGSQARCVVGWILSEDDDVLTVETKDHKRLALNKAYVVKVERGGIP